MWHPSKEKVKSSQMATFIKYVNTNHGLQIEDYSQLYKWSIEKAATFWETFWKFSDVIYHSPYDEIVDDISKMPGALWFKGSTLNFAENLLQYKNFLQPEIEDPLIPPTLFATRELTFPLSKEFRVLA